MARLRHVLPGLHPGAALSTIAHLGPPLGRQGGPGGYLAQLAQGLDQYGAGAHRVLLPLRATGAAPAAERQASGRLLTIARRLRVTYLPSPHYNRPLPDELTRTGGPLAQLIDEAWTTVRESVAESVEQAGGADAEVLFAHDPSSAELALERRRPGQQVWLLLHNPMPLALYLAWSWGVPDRSWQEVGGYPDVQERIRRELRLMTLVDRLFIPCLEAAGELARAAPSFEPALRRVELLMTGAQGPPRRRPSDTVRDLRRFFDLPVDEPVVLFLGNAQPYRGLDAVLAGLRTLPGRRDLPGVVAVAGCPASQLPLRSRLHALGPVAAVGDLLAAVDAVINTNRFSLFDLSTIEALEAGKPLLLHEAGGNRAFVRLGAGCRVFPDLEPRTIGAALTALFNDTPQFRSLGLRSRECWEQALTPRHLRDRHVALYDSVAATGLARQA